VIESYRYDVFGAPAIYDVANPPHQLSSSAYSNRFLFTGREYANLFGFYEYRARAYLPDLGRFMSEDPKLFDAGDYNLFRYCHNDPIDLTDPMGLLPDTNLTTQDARGFAGDMATAYHAVANWIATHDELVGNILINAGMALESCGSGQVVQVIRGPSMRATQRPQAVSRSGYRYVGAKEANTISKEGRIPRVNQKGQPKPVFYTDEKFTTGKAAKTGLDMDSKPTHRAEFSMDQAPAGYGGLTDHSHVEFTLQEGAKPIPVNNLVLLDDAPPELKLEMSSRHVPPKLDR
jgi:RHS repeat-associated protein